MRSGGTYGGGQVQWTVPHIASGTSAQVTFAVSTCQATPINLLYCVVTSTLGVASPWGSPLVTNLAAPTLAADFDCDPHVVGVGGSIAFTDTSTTDGGPLVAWEWDFGDGGTGTGPSFSHTYNATGTFTVTLTITNSCAFTDTVTVVDAVRVTGPGYLLRYFLPIVVRDF